MNLPQGPTIQSPVITSQSPEDDYDKRLWKVLLIGVTTLVMSLGAIYFLNRFLISLEGWHFWVSIAFAFFFLVFVILQALFVKSRSFVFCMIAVQTLGPLTLFYMHLFPVVPWLLVSSAFVFFFLTLRAAQRGRALVMNSVRLHFFQIAKAIVPPSVTALLLFSTGVIYFTYFQIGALTDDLGKKMLGGFLISSEVPLRIAIPDFTSFNQPLKQVLDGIALYQVKRLDLPQEQFRDPRVRARLVDDARTQLLSVIEQFIGPVDSADSLTSILYTYLKNRITGLSDLGRLSVQVVALFLIFFSLKGIAVFLYWFIEVTAFLIFKFLLITRFAYINLQMCQREFIMLS